MTIIESIKNVLLGNNQGKDSPEGYCPNCWGTQQYSGKFYEAIKNEGIDLDHISLKKVGYKIMWIKTSVTLDCKMKMKIWSVSIAKYLLSLANNIEGTDQNAGSATRISSPDLS
ncbi:MAG: hypothetical protein IPL46_22175 [Saprospiraceae bacterium]|nr:hypothetical protein [Saprospiraceae bacterium]